MAVLARLKQIQSEATWFLGSLPLSNTKVEKAALVEVEEIAQESALLPPFVLIPIVVLRFRLVVRWDSASGRWGELKRAIDDLVQLPAVEPNATALRTVIDLDSVSVGDHEIDLGVDGALHRATAPTVRPSRASSLAILFSIGGWVLKRATSPWTPENGLTMQRCAA